MNFFSLGRSYFSIALSVGITGVCTQSFAEPTSRQDTLNHRKPQNTIRLLLLPDSIISPRQTDTLVSIWRGHEGRPHPFPLHRPQSIFPERKNTQFFHYETIDKDGVPTDINIALSDADRSAVKKLTEGGDPANVLEIENLVLFPDFKSNKLSLHFILSRRGNTSVKILNSAFHELFSTRSTFSGNYFKQVTIPKNGLYYLVINQGERWFIKQFIKE
ncbi:hypothetical protein FW774_01220 (plasmid) [Pedobacter sp. BS3]|uniref:hypothetical protein n=1 Tax=Pedobacter sp. BS3 TaxID=2567937 RepID=UPI0011ED8A68|nr:hypothetical protein [Pedobacter sp. BS3]TZF85725.1 hypothetical protein FW774_01220 [Pedobacter sp. BS3]